MLRLAAPRHDERRRQSACTRNIIAGLPAAEEAYTLDQFRKHLAVQRYHKRSCAKTLPSS
ncbi:hypothetical protein ACNKHX_25730 [Shigella flexneri]